MIRLVSRNGSWVLGFEDEVWWSRLAQPHLHAWTEDKPLHLVEKSLSQDDPGPKALCCYGLLLMETRRMWLRFVDGRPVSQVTIDFLQWVISKLEAEGKKVFVLVWDNASWHTSHLVRDWIRAYNRKAKKEGRLRILVCRLPKKSPWLNPIEVRWVHGKRAIVEPVSTLQPDEVIQRVCDYYGCEQVQHLAQNVN